MSKRVNEVKAAWKDVVRAARTYRKAQEKILALCDQVENAEGPLSAKVIGKLGDRFAALYAYDISDAIGDYEMALIASANDNQNESN